MEYLTLKHGDLRVSRICMGGCPMGQYGWGEVRESELLDAVCAAVDHGVNFFDTADTYGLGTSEQTLAKALGARRNDVVIATKFGVRVENGKTFYDNRPEWIEQALAGSLRRLGREYVDLYQIHYRDGKTPVGEVVEKLKELRKKGYLRYFGLSNIHREDLEELLPWKEEFVSFQDEYSLACLEKKRLSRRPGAACADPHDLGKSGTGDLDRKIWPRRSVCAYGPPEPGNLCKLPREETGAESGNCGGAAPHRRGTAKAGGRGGHPVHPGQVSGFGGFVRRQTALSDFEQSGEP